MCGATVREAATEKPFGWRFVSPLFVGAALNPTNSSMIATALIPIGAEFHAGAGSTAVLVAGLYLASAIAQPTMGKLADTFGPRRVFLCGISIVFAAGLIGGFAPNVGTLLVSRVLIGIGTSAGYPTALVLIRRQADRFHTAAPGGVLGGIAIAGQVTAAVGLPLGGVLVGSLGWRSTFFINSPLALIAFAMALTWVPADPVIERHGGIAALVAKLDVLGLVLFGGSVSALLVFLMSLEHPDWIALAATVIVAGALVWWERRAATPFIDLRALGANRPLTTTYLRMCLTSLSIYCVLYGVSQWLEEGKNLSATNAGLVVLPMTAVAAIVTTPVARRGLVRMPLLVGAVAALIVAIGLRVVGVDSPIIVIVALTLVFGLTVGFAYTGNQAALYGQAPPDQVGAAAGLLRTANYSGAILSSSVISLIYNRDGVTDAGLHGIADVLIGLTAVVLVATVLDRRLPRVMPARL
jgi:MFS family permease